ncbi:MAG: glutamate formimidoyltransferase [Euryarchaeota archaeon]|nr:glutamate formimidoyltransferase [Euryarchaeota archaeon]
MTQLVECVPNFSEGRRPEVLEKIASAIRAVPGVKLLDMEYDRDHNRSVFTFVGEPAAVKHAALDAAGVAVGLIDMERHRGEHPRLGALDVLPFVPILGITMAETVELARQAGRELWERLRVPVYFYEEAALSPARRSLPDVRRGEYEGRKLNISEPAWRPDVGEPRMHPTAGATIVGARPPLIAYNVDLETDRLDVAKAIARKVREKDGGLPAVRALGLELSGKGMVQVSMNLVDFRRTGIAAAFEAVRAEAGRAGVRVHRSEVVGLVPLEALVDCAAHYLSLQGFTTDQVLEARLGG